MLHSLPTWTIIERIIADLEKNTQVLTEETRDKVSKLLAPLIPKILEKRQMILKDLNSEESEKAFTEYIIESLDMFYQTLFTIDPDLRHIEAYKKMHLDILTGFLHDMNSIPYYNKLDTQTKIKTITEIRRKRTISIPPQKN